MTFPLLLSINQLKIRVWNARGLQWHKIKTIIEWIEIEEIDIVIAQETWFLNLDYLQQVESFVAHTHALPRQESKMRQKGGLCVFAKSDLKHLISVEAPNRYTLRIKYQDMEIGSTYLRPSEREENCLNYLQQLQRCHIIAGDINASFQSTAKTTQRMDTNDRCKTINNFCMSGNFALVPPEGRGTLLDQVLRRHDAPQITWNKMEEMYGSDHSPMDMVIELWITRDVSGGQDDGYIKDRIFMSALDKPDNEAKKAKRQDAITRFKERKEYLDTTLEALQEWVYEMDRAAIQEVIDIVYVDIQEAIYGSLAEALGTYKTKQVRNKRQVEKPEDTEVIKTANQAFKAIKRSMRSIVKTPLIARNTSRTPAQDVEEHFKRIFKSDALEAGEPMGQGVQTLQEDEEERTRRQRWRNQMEKENVKRVILHYPKTKVPGADAIHVRLLALLIGGGIHETLSTFFTICAEHGVTPKSWNKTHVTLLPKDMGANTIDKMRPITLTSVIRRIFEKMVLEQWQQEEWTKCSRLQAGFVKNKSTLIAALTVDEAIKRGNKICVLLDLKSAYDTVPHRKVIEAMKNRGAMLNDQLLFHSLNARDASTRVVVNGKLSKEIGIKRGVAQGSPLSPLLFNVVMDELIRSLDDGGRIPTASAFADDLNVMGRTPETVQERLFICEQWAEEMEMEWNVPKCAVVGYNNVPLRLYGQEIKQIAMDSITKYVGFDLSARGIQWHKTLERLSTKATTVLTALDNIRNLCTAAVRTTLVKTFVRCIVDYTLAPLHAWMNLKRGARYKTLEPAIQVHRKCLSFIANTASTHNGQVIESMAVLAPPETRALQLRANVFDQVSRLENSPLTQLAKQLQVHDSVLYQLISGNDPLTKAIKEKELPFKSAAKDWVLHNVSRYDGKVLHAFVLPRARVNSVSKIDSVLHQPSAIFEKALAWRRNVAFVQATCVCGTRFTRRHVDLCDFQPTAESVINTRIEVGQEFPVDAYTSLDEHLNNKDYKRFEELFGKVAIVNDIAGFDFSEEERDEEPRARPSQAGLWQTENGVRFPTMLKIQESITRWKEQMV